ncbi:hypothetical protein ACWCQ1_45780 [Streptomyces sp. NPDC002144]
MTTFHDAPAAGPLTPPGSREHLFAPFFYIPRLGARITPLPFPGASDATGVTQDPDHPLFAEFGWSELKGWVRAHPAVARMHHPELTIA